MLPEYAMSKCGALVPDGVCRTLPANAQIRWIIHMFARGLGSAALGTISEENVVEIGVWFDDDDFTESAQYKQDLKLYKVNEQDDLLIPPQISQMTKGFYSFDHPSPIVSF